MGRLPIALSATLAIVMFSTPVFAQQTAEVNSESPTAARAAPPPIRVVQPERSQVPPMTTVVGQPDANERAGGTIFAWPLAVGYAQPSLLSLNGTPDVHSVQLIEIPLVREPLDLTQNSASLWVKGKRPANNTLAQFSLVAKDELLVQQPDGSMLSVFAARRLPAFGVSPKPLEGLKTDTQIYCDPAQADRQKA